MRPAFTPPGAFVSLRNVDVRLPAPKEIRPRSKLGTEHPGLITSRENRWLKLFRAALAGCVPVHSGEKEVIGLEGPHLVEEAVRSGMQLEAILVSPSGENHLQKVLPDTAVRASRPQILRTTEKLFVSLSATERPQGIAALSKPRSWNFDDLLRGSAPPKDVPLVVMLAGVQDPGNVGTILRSAEAFGATGVIAARGSAHPWMPKVLRASAGSALRLPILSGVAPAVALTQLRVSGIKTLAASTRSIPDRPRCAPHEADLQGPIAFVVGNEGGGLPQEIERSVDGLIFIPVVGEVDSLNAAVAASVLLYEAARQREGRS